MTSALIKFKDKLLEVSDNVYHYEAPEESGLPYIVWQEAGGSFTYGDSKPSESVCTIQVNVYSKAEFEPLVDEILKALACDDIACDYPVPVYDDDLKLIRTIIDCEVV